MNYSDFNGENLTFYNQTEVWGMHASLHSFYNIVESGVKHHKSTIRFICINKYPKLQLSS